MPTPQRIFDISPRLSATTAVWPGDSPLRREVLLRLEDGHSVELSTLHSTVHLGAHADAPSHFVANAEAIDQVWLKPYIGRCKVVEVRGVPLIGAEHLTGLIAKGDERILVRTGSAPSPEFFNQDFAAFHPSAIELAADRGVCLLGIDTPSIDPFDSKDLPSHHRLFARGLRNLEGLILGDDVPLGVDLFLSALPLKLGGFDASPVRAVLVQF